MNDKQNNNNNSENKSFHRSNSFTKESSNDIKDKKTKKESINLTSRNISVLLDLQKKYIDKSKEISPTIFDEKIKKNPESIKNNLNKEKNNINKEEYLQVRKIKKISNENFELLKNRIIGIEDLKLLYEDIINCNYLPLNELDFSANVGCLLPLAFLLESLFNNNFINIDEMNYRYELFKKYIYNYRAIKGDGNCFYRAVIFRYIEVIILNKNTGLLKNIINEMHESFNSNEIKSRIRIKFGFILNLKLVLHIMIIILNLLEEGKVSEAHYFYVKSFVIEDSFDYGLILYFRYIFYLYIKKNENKIYLPEFNIKIGNLLPSNYETDKGMFLFNKFYYLYLLFMFKDAEKIIILLTPFVLGINLDVIIFHDNEDKTVKNMIYSGESDYNFNNDKLFVLNINGHYELLYTEEDNNKYKDIFNNYINDYYSQNTIQKNIDNNMTLNQNNVNKNMEENKKEEKEKEKNEEKNEINPVNNEEKNNNDEKENKNNYKVNMKIINRTTQKPDKSFSIEEENNKRNTSEKLRCSEKKDINYKNLIQNKNVEEYNINENKNIPKKDIKNIEKINLIEKLNKEITKKNDTNGNEIINSKENNRKTDNTNKIIHKENNNEINTHNIKTKLNTCKLCINNYIMNNKDEIFQNVCYNCLKNNIMNKIYPIFLSYMKEMISEKISYLAFKTYFNQFIEIEIDVLEENISIKNVLQELNQKMPNNSKISESLEMHSLFQEMKKKFCIFCLKELEYQKYEIPCGCNFCSTDHIKKYFHLKNNFKNKSNYICICSHEYSIEEIYNIGLFFNEIRLCSLREDIIDFLNNNYLEKQCCFCSISINLFDKHRIKIKDFEDEYILGDTNKLRHYVCNNCNYQYQNNVESFSCFICNRNHKIICI